MSKLTFVVCQLWDRSVYKSTGPRGAVGNVSDCRSRGCEFDPGLVPYFRGD